MKIDWIKKGKKNYSCKIMHLNAHFLGNVDFGFKYFYEGASNAEISIITEWLAFPEMHSAPETRNIQAVFLYFSFKSIISVSEATAWSWLCTF